MIHLSLTFNMRLKIIYSKYTVMMLKHHAFSKIQTITTGVVLATLKAPCVSRQSMLLICLEYQKVLLKLQQSGVIQVNGQLNRAQK